MRARNSRLAKALRSQALIVCGNIPTLENFAVCPRSPPVPVKHWRVITGDSSLADAILDRLVHNARPAAVARPEQRPVIGVGLFGATGGVGSGITLWRCQYAAPISSGGKSILFHSVAQEMGRGSS